jgi:PKD repeat protein
MKKEHYTPLLFLFAVVPLFAQVNLTSGLIACYALNGNAAEPVNNLTGTLTSVSGTTDRFNNPNSALSFSGTVGSYVTLPNNSLLKPTNAITISGWYKSNTINNLMTPVFTKNTFSSFFGAYALSMAYMNGGYRFRGTHQTGSSSFFCPSTTNVSANTWYHVVISVSTSSMAIYVNGALENSMSVSLNFNYDPTRYIILGGTNESNYNEPFNGSMDNLRFYSRWLTSAEVSALYQQDPPCIPQASPPVASFSVSNATVCVGGTVSLTDLSTNNPNAWNWQIAGTATTTTGFQNPVMSFTAAGNYVISLTSANSNGLSNTATQTIIVLPNPAVSVIPSLNSSCAGSTVSLTGNGASVYQWGTATAQSISVNPVTTTAYTVTGIAQNGCSATAVHVQTVNPVPNITIAGPSQACAGTNVTLTASGGSTYAWNNQQSTASITVLAAASTVYVVIGTANGCSGMATHSLQVNPLPVVTASVSKPVVCVNEAVTLQAGGALSYSWSTSQVGSSILVIATGPAFYTVTGFDGNNCSNSAVVQVQVKLCTALANNEKQDLIFFPNPVVETLTLKMNEHRNIHVVIRNISGQLLLEKELAGGEAELELSGLPAGVYILEISGTDLRRVERFVKL